MIHEEIVTLEVAKLAKEKGFDEYVEAFYAEDCDIAHSQGPEKWNEYKGRYAAPTQSLLQRWLREEKGVIVYTFPMYMRWYWGVKIVDTEFWYNVADKPHDDFATYEEAMEVGLKYALEKLV